MLLNDQKNILELSIMQLYNEPNGGRYYANIFFQCRREKITYAPAAVSFNPKNKQFILGYNEELFKSYTFEQRLTVLKHEALHLISRHLTHRDMLKWVKKYGMHNFNIAADCAINQLLDERVVDSLGGVTLKGFTKALHDVGYAGQVKAHQPFEYYLQLLDNVKDELKGAGNPLDSHDGFGESGEQESEGADQKLSKEIVDDMLKNVLDKAAQNSIGNMPSNIEGLLESFLPPKMPWKRLLRNFIQAKVKAFTRATRAKRNRRYGILYPGKTTTHKVRLLVGLDTSGSMSDKDLTDCLAEMKGIWNALGKFDIDLVECDSQISLVTKYTGKNEIKVSGRGGTAYQPVVQYAKEHDYDGLIMLGDGGHFDKLVNLGTPTLWMVKNNPSFTPPFGKVVDYDR